MSNDKTYSYNEKVPIEYILYGQYIKYNVLDKLVELEFNDTNTKVINIFIDVYQILLPIYKFFKVENPLSITSCLINMAIHYRHYFYKYGVYTNIFLLYSPTMSSNNTKFCPEYNNKYTNRILNNKYIYDMVNHNLSLMGTIIPYLPDIYFKIGTVETPVMAYDMINKFAVKGFNPPSIFITTSQYAFQLPSIDKNVILFFKKRATGGEDISYTVNYTNALDKFIAETRKQHVTQVPLDQSWLSGFMTLSGIPKRDIKTLFNYRETLKILNHIRSSYNLIKPDVIFEAISNLYNAKAIQLESIINRYQCIDLNYQLSLYQSLPESQELLYLKQYHDPNELNAINEKYFKANPIMLDLL